MKSSNSCQALFHEVELDAEIESLPQTQQAFGDYHAGCRLGLDDAAELLLERRLRAIIATHLAHVGSARTGA